MKENSIENIKENKSLKISNDTDVKEVRNLTLESIERGDEKIPGWDALLNSDISQQSVSALSTTYKVLNVDRIY